MPVDGAERRYRTVGLVNAGNRSPGYHSISIRDGRLTIKPAVLWSRWTPLTLSKPVPSIVRILRPARTPLHWRLQGLVAIDVTFTDGREIKLGVRDPARLEAELSARS